MVWVVAHLVAPLCFGFRFLWFSHQFVKDVSLVAIASSCMRCWSACFIFYYTILSHTRRIQKIKYISCNEYYQRVIILKDNLEKSSVIKIELGLTMLFNFIREHLELIGFILLVDNFIERALPLVVSNPS
eukprot:COSAG01_NODE_228_length_21104_cov_210.303832_28_plen_130_part_00